MLEHSVPFCPAHLHNHCQLWLCFEQMNDDDDDDDDDEDDDDVDDQSVS